MGWGAIVTLSIAVMHKPGREDFMPGILTRLRGEDVTVIEKLVKDRNIWEVAKPCWELAYSSTATHHLVLQDDIGLCVDFIPGAIKALEAKPDEIVTFYSQRKAMLEAQAEGKSWCIFRDCIGACAVAMPVKTAWGFLDWVNRHVRQDYRHDDTRIGLYTMKTGRQVWATVPSLVQHLGVGKSTLGHTLRTNQAKVYIGDLSATAIDWERGAKSPYLGGSNFDKKDLRFYLE